ncbi:MAG: DNA recombination protein RmuC [Urechidicola sp.]|jgi:DNA recombination protein RmuC|tara:strand:- start:1509 stop:2828 length:1320 start_codon:yes stop_codon:yes gene_type:complete
MNEILIYIIVALLIGFVIGNLLAKGSLESLRTSLKDNQKALEDTKNDTSRTINQLKQEAKDIQTEKEDILRVNIRQDEAIKNFKEKLDTQKEEVENLQKKFTKEFENLANKILEEKSTKFTEQNSKNLQEILKPLQSNIDKFEKRVEDTHKDNIRQSSALKQQLEELSKNNLKISQEAINLTKALKGDNKTQGNWGELILERVLEKSGLEKGREYEMEKSFNVDDENHLRLRPDVIIHLPDNKKMVIDSKVSLTAYEQFVNSENEDEKAQFLKDHISSLNRHVSQLSDKKYEDLYQIESPDFVLLFVPIEPAFALAINQDNQLYNKAFEKNIVIVTPSTLLATLRTIDTMWNNEKQQRNAIEISRQAGALYDKFEGLVTDLTKVGKKMDEAKTEYKGAMNKLVDGRGNLISSVEKIKKLGAKAKKALPKAIIERANEDE